MKTAEEILKKVVHRYQQEHGEDSGFTIDFHVKPKEGGPGATVYILTDLMGQAMEEYAAQFQAPALPEATVEGLFGKFVHAFDIALSNQIPTREDVWKQFLPAIQEVIAAEKERYHKNMAERCVTAERLLWSLEPKLADKDAEIKLLKAKVSLASRALKSKQVDIEELYKDGIDIIADMDGEMKALRQTCDEYKEEIQLLKEKFSLSEMGKYSAKSDCEKLITEVGDLKKENDVLIGDNNRLTQQLEEMDNRRAFLQVQLDGAKLFEERKGMQWVKAKERFPAAGQTVFLKAWGSFEIGHYGSDSELFVSREENLYRLEDVEWLDESAPLPDSKQEASPWISVIEKSHPEKPGKKSYEHVPCLVVHKRWGIRSLMWNCQHLCWDDESGDDFVCDDSEITHWMEIPEPPKNDQQSQSKEDI